MSRRRRYVTKAEVEAKRALIVRSDDYTEACDRCGAPQGQPCVLQNESFRQYPNTKVIGNYQLGCEVVPAGTVALRIHWERRQAVLDRRGHDAWKGGGYHGLED